MEEDELFLLGKKATISFIRSASRSLKDETIYAFAFLFSGEQQSMAPYIATEERLEIQCRSYLEKGYTTTDEGVFRDYLRWSDLSLTSWNGASGFFDDLHSNLLLSIKSGDWPLFTQRIAECTLRILLDPDIDDELSELNLSPNFTKVRGYWGDIPSEWIADGNPEEISELFLKQSCYQSFKKHVTAPKR